MKKTGLLFALAMTACTIGMGQQTAITERYWVVETHNRDTIYSIVRFFDGGNNLLHEVRVDNVAIDIQQKKNRKRLDQLLADYTVRASRSVKRLKTKPSV